MKIAMVGQFPPHIGGVGVHIHSLAKKLVKNGDEVFVITYPHKNIENIDGINVIGTKGPNIGGLRSLFFVLFGTIQLINTIRKYDIDIIHGHYLYPAGLVAVLAGIFTKKQVYVTSHGSDMFCLYPQHKFMQPILKFVLKHADVILAVSEALKEEILKVNIPNIENKTKIYWNSVDVDKFHPNEKAKFKKELKIPANQPMILFVGNIIKRKNVVTLLKAKQLMKENCTLVVVGGGPLLNKLKKRVCDEKIANVIFTGPRNDIENIIPSADLLILPSYSESFGLVLIEALACGKPVIGSNVGGIKEIITKDVGLLIDPKNPKDLANAIDLILSDDELRSKFKLNARKRAMDFAEAEIPYYN
ncbi:putative teichuronic acid biosynthesis glycosyltransferase TuaC [Methanobrevibacter cuticularis]|uniref:Putative teichuronic acid biosynthesis glycosyltransferase TuaC n=1 Tax=Methanobrevibacter cuticularis TaxID=47311 RepID=A0A166F6Y4_9EURY|nr:glycosyltransferase family 4 protein [Methanobrevibacter cuticularis]KZX17379.1 putative teichuronic acid biosynthesis glycosyltransferase TuaC [Methanobrevibacter cuticularis]